MYYLGHRRPRTLQNTHVGVLSRCVWLHGNTSSHFPNFQQCRHRAGAHGIALVYDVCDRASFENIQEWLREVDLYCTNEACVKLLIGNKIDRAAERVVTKAEATAYARANNMLSLETSAKSAAGVCEAFTELVQKILDQPSTQAQQLAPVTAGSGGGGGGGGKKKSSASAAVKLDERAPAQSYCFGACYSNA